MQQDRYGNALATASTTARDLYDLAMDAVLSGAHDMAERFEAVVAEAPDLVLGHTGLARARQLTGDMAGARSAVAAGGALSPADGSCEALHVAVMGDMLSGKGAAAYPVIRAHVADHPRDAMIAQFCTSIFGLIGFSGQPGREAELLAYTAGLLPQYGEDWWMLSQHAFSLCETGQTDKADAMIDRSLALKPGSSHGAHVRSHVYYEAGETGAGLSYLEGWLEGLDRRALLHGHLSWHVALWALERGETERMWRIVENDLRPEVAEGLPINVLSDMASILYRAELAGEAVDPARWKAISGYATQVFPNTSLSFIDMHAAVAHAMAGEVAALEKIIADAKGPAADMVRTLSTAFGAIARQDWAGAAREFATALGDTARVGGSRAQRDLLEFAYLAVLLKLGRGEEAANLLPLRRPALTGMHAVAGLPPVRIH